MWLIMVAVCAGARCSLVGRFGAARPRQTARGGQTSDVLAALIVPDGQEEQPEVQPASQPASQPELQLLWSQPSQPESQLPPKKPSQLESQL